MPPSAIAQRRTHNLLLFQKLLNLRDGASPFTLLLDTLEQSARPVMREFVVRAKISKTKTIFVSFQTLRKPDNVDIFIVARKKQLAALSKEISSHLATPQAVPSRGVQTAKTLLIFDSLSPLSATSPTSIPSFLSTFLSPTVSILATYHTDVPIPAHPQPNTPPNPYAPDPLTTLVYLATAILRVSNLWQTIEKKRARDRSLQEPVFGLEERKEGVLTGLLARRPTTEGVSPASSEGIVVEMEARRKSGRAIREVFVLSTSSQPPNTTPQGVPRAELGGRLCLLDDHPLYAPPSLPSTAGDSAVDGDHGDGEGDVETTFNLGLTEKQRKDREGVVLPYFDAQRGDGVGEGGRILYEMDRVDDFDEEEDEI